MLLNIVLLFLVFGAAKKKFSPYLAAVLFGVCKAVILLIAVRNVLGAVIYGGIYAALVAAFVYFLRRIERREDRERPATPEYGVAGSDKIKVKWEYFPLFLLLVLIVGGEMILAFL